jgi:hypothetical protein
VFRSPEAIQYSRSDDRVGLVLVGHERPPGRPVA